MQTRSNVHADTRRRKEKNVITLATDVLTREELDAVQAGIKTAPYVDGANTAGWSARSVKKNQQLALDSQAYEKLAGIVRTAFLRNDTLQTALLPASVTKVMFNRYGTGMTYGPHVDSPMMGSVGNMLRTDIAMTLFLSDPESYDGGELVVHAGKNQEYTFKHEAGSAIAYPANTLHHVTPVTRGTRNAAILWVQSLVRDPAKREILWDLEHVKRDIFGREGKSSAFDATDRSHANLLRLWANE